MSVVVGLNAFGSFAFRVTEYDPTSAFTAVPVNLTSALSNYSHDAAGVTS